MAQQWSRRAVLHLLGISAVSLGGCTALGDSKNAQPLTEKYEEMLEFEEPITYEHDHLQLSGPEQPVAGDTIEFTVTNTSMTEISLGCGNPWTLQQQRNGRWREMMWTTSDVFNACLSVLKPGDSITENVTLRRSALETESEIVKHEFIPGLYRFVLLASDPFFTTNFRINPSK
ncbi:immunoglobulin-like domain-containing protein (plasmid) [Haladaptatus sp. SPP-AMP-3]|uniref:immunoglobulin-like domain-containing protein n=1 Tax=Haladaptatus sp. SPP-AMP-3 TaxID=3121295 RepID=UPI003C2F07C0